MVTLIYTNTYSTKKVLDIIYKRGGYKKIFDNILFIVVRIKPSYEKSRHICQTAFQISFEIFRVIAEFKRWTDTNKEQNGTKALFKSILRLETR